MILPGMNLVESTGVACLITEKTKLKHKPGKIPIGYTFVEKVKQFGETTNWKRDFIFVKVTFLQSALILPFETHPEEIIRLL